MKHAIGSIVKTTRKNILLLGLVLGLVGFGLVALKAAGATASSAQPVAEALAKGGNTGSAVAVPTPPYERLSDMPSQSRPAEPVGSQTDVPSSPQAGETFYAARPAFDTANPGLPIEDFQEGNVPASSVVVCPNPVNAATNNACFTTGQILPGVSFSSSAAHTADEIAMLGAGFAGNPSKNIVANYFVDSFDITFSVPVRSAGMDLVSYGPGPVTVSIYNTSNVFVTSVSVNATAAGTFWGVQTPYDIGRINIFSPGNQAEGVDNIAFGTSCSPNVLLIDDTGGFGAAAGILTTAGFNVTVVNNEFANAYANLLNGAYLSGFGFVVYGERGTGGSGSVLPAPVVASLEAYIQNGGNLLVTGYDTLGSPTDNNLAGLVRSSTSGDQISGIPNWQTTSVNNFILNGPYGDFRNLSFVGIGYDDDVLAPNGGAGAIELASTPGASSKIIFTDLPGAAGSVGYWNGGNSGTGTDAQPDFYSGGNPQNIFLNWAAGVACAAPPSTTPVVTPPANQAANEAASTAFNLGSFADPDGGPWTVTVNWGDGSPNTVFNVAAAGSLGTQNHTYADDNPTGTASDPYTVTVTVADSGALSGNASFTMTVNNIAPSNIIRSFTGVVNENGVVTLDASFTDPGTLDTHAVTINWGDGSAVQTINLAAGVLSIPATTHTYLDDNPTGTSSDQYTISVSVTDDDTGSVGPLTGLVTVNNVAPTGVVVNLSAGTINENGSTSVSGLFIDPGTLDTHTVTINWGDGSTNTTINLGAGVLTYGPTSHTYLDDNPTGTSSDTYNIVVTVVDDDTGSGNAANTVTVNNVAPSAITLAMNPTTINEGQSSSVSGSFTDPGTQDTHTVTINWGDGSANTVVNLAAGVLVIPPTAHTYLDDNPAGTSSDVYTITVGVADDDLGSARPTGVGDRADTSSFTGDTSAQYATILAERLRTHSVVRDPAIPEAFATGTAPETENPLVSACNNGSSFGSAAAPTGAGVVTISTCSFQSEYSTITGMVAGNRYVVTASIAGSFITVRYNTPGGLVVATGVSPLQFTAPTAGTYFTHWNTNSACGTAGACMTTTIACASCGAAASQCTTGANFATITAPTVLNAPATMSSCNFQSEYNTINSVVANRIYQVTGLAGTFITIRQGTPAGPVIASGVTPLAFTATVAGTYFTHFNTNSACGTASSCITTTMEYIGNANAGPPPATTTVTVNNVNPTATFTNGGPYVFGQPGMVTFSAQADPSAADLAGVRYSYDFDNNGTFEVGTGVWATSAGTVATAVVPPAFLIPVGPHVVRGRIMDDDLGFTDYLTTIIVNKANTTTTVTAVPVSPSIFGQPVTFTATVAVVPPGAGTPTGTVTFNIDGNNYCVNTPLVGLTATCTQAGLPALPAGLRNVVAIYNGDASFNVSAGTLNYTVLKADTTTAITSDVPDPSLVNQPYTVTWTVTAVAPGAGTPTGTVTINGGAGGGTCTATVAAGGCQLTPTTIGVKTIQATYNGDANFNTSTSATTTHTVNVSISGTVRNGLTLAPIPGVTIALYQFPGGTFITSTTTNAAGLYTFAGQFVGPLATQPTVLFPPYYDPQFRNIPSTATNVTGMDFLSYATVPDIPRVLSMTTQYVVPGAAGSMPFILNSQGNEVLVSFSISYDINPFSQPPVFVCGADAPGCTITNNTSVLGRVGVTIVPAGGSFARDGEAPNAPGLKEIARMNFLTVATPVIPSTPIAFVAGGPVAFSIIDVANNPLLTVTSPRNVVFVIGNEGDVATRNGGSGTFESGDVIQTRRFVTQLDTAFVNTFNEFQRADTAPGSTKGDGVLDATDLVQTRRYVASLDAAQSAGGAGFPNPAMRIAPQSKVTAPSEITAGSAQATNNTRAHVPVSMRSTGTETAVSFTVRYNETRLVDPTVTLAGGAPDGAILTVNTSEPGVIRILIDSANVFGSTDVASLVDITFDVTADAPSGDALIEIEDLVFSDMEARATNSKATSGTISIAGANPAETDRPARVRDQERRATRKVTLPDSDLIEEWLNRSTIVLKRPID